MDEPSLRKTQWYSLAIVIFAGDQAAKSYIDATTPLGWSHEVASFFNLVHALNPGAAFSFLSDAGGWQRWFFTLLALGVSGWIVALLRRHSSDFRLSLALTLILSGALGNVVDRLRFGAVVDFIQWHLAGLYWPAFNVADSAITLGAALLVWDQLFTKTSKQNVGDAEQSHLN